MPRFGPSDAKRGKDMDAKRGKDIYDKRGKDFDAKHGKDIGSKRSLFFFLFLEAMCRKLLRLEFPSNEIKKRLENYAKQSNHCFRVCLCVV